MFDFHISTCLYTNVFLPTSNRWNCVRLSYISNWNIRIGPLSYSNNFTVLIILDQRVEQPSERLTRKVVSIYKLFVVIFFFPLRFTTCPRNCFSVKPTLKKVSKYENKFAKLQKKAAEFNFRNQLKVVKKKEFTLEEEDKEVRFSVIVTVCVNVPINDPITFLLFRYRKNQIGPKRETRRR